MFASLILHAGPHGHLHTGDLLMLAGVAVFGAFLIVVQKIRS